MSKTEFEAFFITKKYILLKLINKELPYNSYETIYKSIFRLRFCF